MGQVSSAGKGQLCAVVQFVIKSSRELIENQEVESIVG